MSLPRASVPLRRNANCPNRNRSARQSPASIRIHFEGGDECLLRDLDAAELPHSLFAFLLLVEKFAFARNVAAIALGGDILAQRLDGFSRDNLAADRRLHRNLEQMSWNQILELLAHRPAASFGARAVHDHG